MDIALINNIVALARKAGDAIMQVYGTGFEVEYKDDASPLTLADSRSHAVIEEGLLALTPSIPLLSEEGLVADFAARRKWTEFWLVDPLDGTKEFISRNGEFTVNIALIKDGVPVFGVIGVPAQGVMYYGGLGMGAFKTVADGSPEPISIKSLSPEGYTVVASRSHGSEELEAFLSKITVRERITSGSSLKFCLVAEGRADLYPRFGPTWEWDTGAGHAIIKAAGGVVTDTTGAQELAYNKETPKHSGFIVCSTEIIRTLPLGMDR